mmetsp:Transcript_32732/g.72178  ORF Transcript_32732/g.72178 Transcript_32732/m.72178 type:complete len:330 (-) Transcript_32732:648-1637(-)
MYSQSALLLLASVVVASSDAFVIPGTFSRSASASTNRHTSGCSGSDTPSHCQTMTVLRSTVPSGTGFGGVASVQESEATESTTATAVADKEDDSSSSSSSDQQQSQQLESSNIPKELQEMSAQTVKELLVDLLPRMTGKADEFHKVENYINALEDKYEPVQTLQFLNMAMGGEWQLLFSTNRLGVPNTRLRLRELVQRVEPKANDGAVINVARWDLAEDGTVFDASGTFSVKCDYTINQGARMNIDLRDHVLELARGSKVPQDVQGLVGMLHGAMPSELFDPNELAMDTTYLDGDVRIVRLTGDRLEGVRNVFIRSGSVEVDPTKKEII